MLVTLCNVENQEDKDSSPLHSSLNPCVDHYLSKFFPGDELNDFINDASKQQKPHDGCSINICGMGEYNNEHLRTKNNGVFYILPTWKDALNTL